MKTSSIEIVCGIWRRVGGTRKHFLLLLLISLLFGGGTCFGESSLRTNDEQLVRIGQDPIDEADIEYEKTWRRKLLVTPGDIARFVHLPGNAGAETSMSIHRKQADGRGEYWVTVTQANQSLWNCFAPGTTARVEPNAIGVLRLDVQLPEKTALLLRKVWLKMLRNSRPQTEPNGIMLDASTEIFSASADDGQPLEGRLKGIGKGVVSAFADLANLLVVYGDTAPDKRPGAIAKIEVEAKALLEELDRRQRN